MLAMPATSRQALVPVASVCCAVAAASGQPCAAPIFSGQIVSTGDQPIATAQGDLNADGLPDLVVTNFGSGDVSVWLNAGFGQYPLGVRYPVGQSPQGVAIGDVNADGAPDLVVANQSDDTISVLINDGAASFAEATSFVAGDGATAVALADVDGDADLDAIVANYVDDTVSVLLNDGSGLFGAPTDTAVGARPISIVTGDLDADGDIDAVTANEASGDVSVLLNDGAGVMTLGSTVAVGPGPTSATLADLDGNGSLDLAVANFQSGGVTVLSNNGGGAFGAPTTLATDASASSVVAADLNGDGAADLIATDFATAEAIVLLNDGSGGFQAPSSYSTGDGAVGLSVADIDGDRDVDVGFATLTRKRAGFLRGDGTGSLAEQRVIDVDTRLTGVVIADFDDDGWPDVAATARDDGDVRLLRSMAGVLDPVGVVGAFSSPFRRLRAVDLNGDGATDLLSADDRFVDGPVELLVNDGSGGFKAAEPILGDLEVEEFDLVDLDDDGDLDFVVYAGDRLYSFENGDDGAFVERELTEVLPLSSASVGGIRVVDLDNDGHRDILVGSVNSVHALFADGAGSFLPLATLFEDVSVPSIDVGDVDGDGDLDLVRTAWKQQRPFPLPNSIPAGVYLHRNNGSGQFEPAEYVAPFEHPEEIELRDLDRDGDLDIVVGATFLFEGDNGGFVATLVNDGGGQFGLTSQVNAQILSLNFAIGDLNVDGRLDMVVTSSQFPKAFVSTGLCVDVPPCSAADLAVPLGTLDIADVVGFLQLFGDQDASADLGAPVGVFDIADVIAFLQVFGAGCP